jgi:hypothetical protein
MLEATEDEISQLPDSPLGYLLPKSLFKNPGVFSTSPIGGVGETAKQILTEFDYVGIRDAHSMIDSEYHYVPDCVVMIKELFDKEIQIRNREKPISELQDSLGEYIAVQINSGLLEKSALYFEELLTTLSETTDLPIVFFCAGIAPQHDNLTTYVDTFTNFPPGMIWHFDDYNIWNICNVIANAKLVISTSLHVQIVASAYSVPRFLVGGCRKVAAFSNEWDTGNHDYMQTAHKDQFDRWYKRFLDQLQ